jgi:hypothetical protein
MQDKSNLYIVSVNLLIEWMKQDVIEEDRTISTLFITALKEYRKRKELAAEKEG